MNGPTALGMVLAMLVDPKGKPVLGGSGKGQLYATGDALVVLKPTRAQDALHRGATAVLLGSVVLVLANLFTWKSPTALWIAIALQAAYWLTLPMRRRALDPVPLAAEALAVASAGRALVKVPASAILRTVPPEPPRRGLRKPARFELADGALEIYLSEEQYRERGRWRSARTAVSHPQGYRLSANHHVPSSCSKQSGAPGVGTPGARKSMQGRPASPARGSGTNDTAIATSVLERSSSASDCGERAPVAVASPKNVAWSHEPAARRSRATFARGTVRAPQRSPAGGTRATRASTFFATISRRSASPTGRAPARSQRAAAPRRPRPPARAARSRRGPGGLRRAPPHGRSGRAARQAAPQGIRQRRRWISSGPFHSRWSISGFLATARGRPGLPERRTTVQPEWRASISATPR